MATTFNAFARAMIFHCNGVCRSDCELISELRQEQEQQFFRFVRSLAWLTPVVIWCGIGETSKVLIIIYTTIFIVLINTMVGVSHIAPNKLRAAACLGATPLTAFIFVTLPATLPFILTGMRLAMG